jgi:hypothetical protein
VATRVHARTAMQRRRGRWVRVAAALFPMLLTLLALEIGFGVAESRRKPFIDNGVYPSNPRGYFDACGENFCVPFERETTNGCGVPQDPSRESVLFVGDSFAFGLGVRAADSFPSRLEFPGLQRRNCAYPGYNVLQAAESFDRTAAAVGKPALTVYAMVLNDLDNVAPENGTELWTNDDAELTRRRFMNDFINLRTKNVQEYYDRKRSELGTLRVLLYSRTAAWIYRTWLMKQVSDATTEWYHTAYLPGPRRDRAFSAIARMAAGSQRFLLVLFPLFVDLDDYPFEVEHREIVAEARRRGLEVLDLLEVFRGKNEQELIVYPTDRHPNEIAHALAADAIRARLQELGWAPLAAAARAP